MFQGWYAVGITNRTLGGMMGVADETIGEWSSGQKKCPPEIVIFLTGLLTECIRWLGENPPKKSPENAPANRRELYEERLQEARRWLRASERYCGTLPHEAHRAARRLVKERLAFRAC